MEKVRRRIFFWSLVLVFLTVAPTIVLYSRGFRFDLSRGVFVHSGTVTIKSNPQSIDVALNNKLFNSKTLNRINNSFNLPGLLPGIYDIKVSASDFQTWNKKIDVHSGLATEFWNILLVRNSYKKNSFEDTNGINTFYMSPKNKYIAYTTDLDATLGIKIFNIDTKKTEQSFSLADWKFIDESRRENIEWSPEEDYLIIPVQKEKTIQPSPLAKNAKNITANTSPQSAITYGYYVINPENETSFNLNEFLEKEDIGHVRWDPKNKDYVFFLLGKSLYRANTKDKTELTLISDNVSSYDLTKNNVYYVKEPNNLVYKSSLDGKSSQDQITNSFPGTSEDPVDRLIMYDETRIGFITKNKNIIVYNEGERDTYFKKLAGNVEGLHFSDDGKKLLFWTNNEIFVYFLQDWKVAPVRSENDMTSITRYSEPIKNVEWFKDYEHIIFSTGKWTKIIELDPRDHRNCMDLISTNIETPFIRYNNYWEFMYFTDKTGDTTTLNYIVFPEPASLLDLVG